MKLTLVQVVDCQGANVTEYLRSALKELTGWKDLKVDYCPLYEIRAKYYIDVDSMRKYRMAIYASLKVGLVEYHGSYRNVELQSGLKAGSEVDLAAIARKVAWEMQRECNGRD